MCMTDNGPAKWSKLVGDKADELIEQLATGEETITSLSFKLALRGVIGPDESIIQQDASNYLRQWYLNDGGKDNYDIVDNGTYMTYTPKLSIIQKAEDQIRETLKHVPDKSDGDDT